MKQRIVACPIRNDGHDAEGNPGDCLRASVAWVLQENYDEVPHFGLHLNWWDSMRRWARSRGRDFGCWRPGDDRWWEGALLLIGSGPSPRGPFWHVVVVDENLDLVFDPHPSDAGLTSVEEVFVYCLPYEPAPSQLMLEAAA